jgi:hypothetical protein
MNRPVRLHDLSHHQIGALLLAARGPLRWTSRGWGVDAHAHIHRTTFTAMVRLGLFRMRQAAPGKRTGDLTVAGEALATLAINLSREIAAGVVGLAGPALIALPAADCAAEPDQDHAADEAAADPHLLKHDAGARRAPAA